MKLTYYQLSLGKESNKIDTVKVAKELPGKTLVRKIRALP